MRSLGLAPVLTLALALTVTLAARSAAADVLTDVNEVHACRPLGDGAFLVGTSGGLVRVDAQGVARSVWTAVDGLPGTRVDAIFADGRDLWIGSEAGAALVELDGATLRVRRKVASKPVRDLVRQGRVLYVATWGGGVLALGRDGRATKVAFAGKSEGKGKKAAAQDAARARVAALALVDGTLYAGTAAGLFRLEQGRLAPVPLAQATPEVTSLLGDGARLWIATTDGLYAYDNDALRAYGGGELRRVARVDGAVWVAGPGLGLARVERGRIVADAGAPRGLLMAEALDEQGGAACAGGLDGLWWRARAEAAWLAGARRAGPPSNDISVLAVDGERLWVGTFDHGLATYEHGAWRRIVHRDLDRRINALVVEPRPGKPSRLWVASAAGLAVIDGDDVARVAKRDGLPARGVLSLALLSDGRLLVGTSAGAALVGDGRPVILAAKQGLDMGNVWAVSQDADGFLWLGTTTGLYRGRADDGTAWTRFSVATGALRDDWVMALAPRGRSMWVGTYHGGVVRLDWNEHDVRVTSLGEGWINPGGLRWVNDTLYAATMDGLLAGNGTEAAWRHVAGLPGRDCTGIVGMGEAAFVATRRGLLALSAPP